jgi:hypothetical protein
VTAVPRRLLLAALAVIALLLTACDSGSDSSSADSTPRSTSATSATSAADEPSGSAASSADPKSQALCSAVTNAAAGGPWKLDEPVASTRQVAGVPVPGCDATGDSGTSLTVAFLPAAGGLAGSDLLTGLCQAVVDVKATADDRFCVGPKQAKVGNGDEVRRVDLMDGDGGVVITSFSSNRPEYVKHAVADLSAFGEALAKDSLLARALG